jgi:hypothetical protein
MVMVILNRILAAQSVKRVRSVPHIKLIMSTMLLAIAVIMLFHVVIKGTDVLGIKEYPCLRLLRAK